MRGRAPGSSRLRPGGRVARVVLGAFAALAGLAGAAAAFLLIADVVARPSMAPTPERASGAVGLGFGVASLFGALAIMGLQRVGAGVRGWRSSVRLRLHGSHASRWSLLGLAGAALLAGLALSGGSVPFRWLALPLLGMAFVLVPLSFLVVAPDRACAFCGSPRPSVKELLAGDATSLCDDCARTAMTVLAKQADERGEAETWCDGLLHLLPPRCPRTLSRAFVERLVGQDRTGAGLRNAAGWALRLANEPLARELLEELPESERRPTDWLNLGVALADSGLDAEALQATERADGDRAARPWLLNNTVWLRTQLRPGSAPPERARWLVDVEEAQRLLGDDAPEGWKRSMCWFRATEAEVRRLSGDLLGALDVLERAEAGHPLAGEQRALRARVLMDLGRRDEARVELEHALRLLHPEARSARDARALLASLSPDAPALPGGGQA